jgi:glycosyltransferase involved in cell wall biosynthesis
VQHDGISRGRPTPEDTLATSRDDGAPVVVLLPWGQVIEDYLDTIGIGIDDFVDAMDGGWMFGYIDALATAGIATTIVWPSRTVSAPQRRTHARTGAPVWFIPPTRTWRWLRRAVDDAYASHPADAAPRRSRPLRAIATIAHTLLPWTATPLRAIVRVLRAEHANVLLCQDYEEARFDTCVAFRRVLGVPVYAVFQGGVLQRTPLERYTRGRAIRAASGFVIGAATEARRVEAEYHVGSDRVSVVPNPLPLDEWPVGERAAARAALDIPQDAGVVCWHGRIAIAQKGLDVLLDAWQMVTDARPSRELVLFLTGDGPDSAQLRGKLERRALPGVRWIDTYVLDRGVIKTRLAAADVAVLSSRAEGFAVAPLESMASGRALVAAAAPGVTDLAPRGEADGVVVVPQGDTAALARALGDLLDDPARATALGHAARARVANAFSLDVVGARLAERFGLAANGYSLPSPAPR